MERHSKHYEVMNIQPYVIMRQLDILEPYLLATAIKYLMRFGSKNPDDPELEAQMDVQKAIAVLTDLISEMENSNVQLA